MGFYGDEGCKLPGPRILHYSTNSLILQVWRMIQGFRGLQGLRLGAEGLGRVIGCRGCSACIGQAPFWRQSLPESCCSSSVLKGSWDLVTEVINKVAVVILTYNPN